MGDGLVTVSVEAQMNGDRVVIGGGEMLIAPPYLFEMTIEGEPSEEQSVITFTASLESAKHTLSHLMLYTTYAGNHAITVTVNDTGNYGSGGAMVTSLDLDVNVTESKTPNIPMLVTPLGVLVVNQGSELLVSGIRIDIPWSSSMWIEEEGDSIMRLLAMSVKIKSSTSGSILKTTLSHSNAVALGLISISGTNSTTSSGNEVELVGTLFGICHAMEMPFIYAPPPGFTGIDTLVLEAEAVDNMHSLLYNAAGSVHGTWNWTSTAHMNILVTNADHTSQLSPAKIIGGEAISAQYDKIIPVTAFSLVPIYDNHTAITLSVKCSAGTLDLGPAQAGLWVHSQSSSDLVSVSGLPKNINSLLSAGKLLYKIPLDKTSDDTVERTVDLCAWIVGYAGDEAPHMCTSIVIQPMEHWASLSPTELLNGLKSDGLLHMKEGESIRLSSIFSVSAGGNEAGELFEMNVSAVTGTREGRIWFSNVSSIAQASPVAVSGSGTALLSLVASPEDMSFLVEHILFHPPYLFNGVSWLKISIVFFAGHLSSILSSKTVPIVFEAVNNPPQIQVLPGSDVFYGIQDQIIEIGSRGLYVTDPDAQENGFSASLNVTVSVIEGRGTLELSHNSPEIAGTKLSVKYGSGSISLTGPIEALNVALASLIFIPDSKWSGLARIRLKADDLGNTGFGGPQQAIPVELVVHIDAIVAPPRIIAPQYYSGFQGRAVELLNVTIMDESTAPGTEIQLHVSSTKDATVDLLLQQDEVGVFMSGTLSAVQSMIRSALFSLEGLVGQAVISMVASRDEFAIKGPYSFSVVEIVSSWTPPTLSCPSILYGEEDQETEIESVLLNDKSSNTTLDKYFQQELLSLRIATMQGGAIWLQAWPPGTFPGSSMIGSITTDIQSAAARDELVFSGFLNDICSALLQLSYKGPKDVWGSEVDEIIVSLYRGIDELGSESPIITSCSISVDLSPVNDPPQISNALPLTPSSVYDLENGSQRWGWVNVEGLYVSDVDDENLHVRVSAICEGCIAELWLPLNASTGPGKHYLTVLWPEKEEEDMSAVSGSVIEVKGSITDINLALSAMLFSGQPSPGTGIAIQVQDKAGGSNFSFIPHGLPVVEEIIKMSLPRINASVGDDGPLKSSHLVEIAQGTTLSLGSAAGLVVYDGMTSFSQDEVPPHQDMSAVRALVQSRHGAMLEIQSIVMSAPMASQLGGSFSISIGAEEAWYSVPFSATEEDMATAITSLPGISAVEVSRSAEDSQGGREWLVTFISAGGGGDIPMLKTSSVNLSGVGARIEVNEVQRGFGRPELWVISTYAPHRDIILELTLMHPDLEIFFSNLGFVTLFNKNHQLLTSMNGGRIYPETVSTKSNEEPSATAMKWLWSTWAGDGGLPGTRKGESIQSIMESENIALNLKASVDVVKYISSDKTSVTWTIAIRNAMYNMSIPELDDSNWNGPPGSALLRVVSSRNEISGNFTIRINEVSTRSLPVEASSEDVSEAVNELEHDIGARVVVARNPSKDFDGGYTWDMAFVSDPRSSFGIRYSVKTIGDLDWGGVSARCVQQGGSEGSFMWLGSWGERLKVEGGITNSSSTIDLLGTPVAINQALRNLEYKSSSTWSGIVFFDVFVSSSLKPHDYTDTRIFSISVTSNRHPPEILWCSSLLLGDGLQTQTVAYLLEDSRLSFEKYSCETTGEEPGVTNHAELDVRSEFNSKGGSVLSVKDPDNSVAAELSLNITVGHGYLSTSQSGKSMPVSLSFNGTVEAVNQFLRSMEYVPNSIFFGVDMLTISVSWDDHELLGVGDFSASPLMTRRELVLMVEAVNDPPTVEASNDMLHSMSDILHISSGLKENVFIVQTEENVPFHPLLGLKVVDVDATLIMVELSCTIGQIKLLPTDSMGLSMYPITTTTGLSHQRLQFIGRIHDINACIEKVSYEPLADWNGIDRIQLSILDVPNNSVNYEFHTSNSGVVAAIVAVVVTQVNRSPVIHMPLPPAAIQCINGSTLGDTSVEPTLSGSSSHLPYIIEDQVSVIGRHHIELSSIVEIQIKNGGSEALPTVVKNILNGDMQSNSGILLSETSIYLSDPGEERSSSLNGTAEAYYRILEITEENVTLDLPMAEMGEGIFNVSLTAVHGLISISPSVPVDLLLEVNATAPVTAGWMVDSLSFSSTLSVANQVLEGLSFVSEQNFNTELFGDVALLKVSVSNEGGYQSIGQLILPVYPENDPPVIVPPDGMGITQTYVTDDNVTSTHLTYDQQSPLVMSCLPFHIMEGGSLNFAGWSIRDVDIGETPSMQSSLFIDFKAKAVFGSLVLEGSPQVSVLQKSEDGTLISFLATPHAATEALAKLRYFGGDFMWGSDAVTLTVSDMMNSGQCIISNLSSGCSLSHTLTVPIEVEGVPSPPVVVMPWEGYATVDEDTDFQLWGLYVEDVDTTRHFSIDGTTSTMEENCPMMIVNVSFEEGSVTLHHQTKDNLTWIMPPVDNNNSTDQEEGVREQEIVIAGSTVSVNETLNGATFRPNSNIHTHGRQDLQVTVSAYCQKGEDYENPNINGELVGKGVLHVKVNSVNDYPEIIITQPEPLSWMEDEIFCLPFTVDDVDLQQGITSNVMPTYGYNTLKVNMSCTHGSIVMGSTVGLQVIINHDEKQQNYWWCIRGTRDAIRLALLRGKIVPEANFFGDLVISVRVSDDEGGWTEDEIVIEIIPVDDPPSWKVPTYPISVTEGEAMNIGKLIELVDPDEDGDIMIELKAVKGSISMPPFLPMAGLEIGLEHLVSPPFNLSDQFNATWSRTLTITGPSPGLNKALKSLVYVPPKNWEEDFDKVTLVARDTLGSGCGESGLFIRLDNNVNDAPIVIPPGVVLTSEPCSVTHLTSGLCYRVQDVVPLDTLEDTQRTLEGLHVFDADAEKSPYALISIEMVAMHGTLSCLHVLCGDSDTPAMKLDVTASLSTVNAALSSVWYMPHMDWYGNDTITVLVNDNGFTGSGGSKEDSVTIDVQVEPQLDHPILLVDVNSTWLSGLEDERITIGPVNVLHADANAPRVHNLLYPISIMENKTSPVDDYVLTDPYIDLTAMSTNGHLMLGSTKGLRFLLPANGSGSYLSGGGLERSDEGIDPVVWWSAVSFRGKLSDVETSLQVMMYKPNSNWHGIDTVQFTAANAGDESPPIGMGGEVNMSISIVPVPDAPVIIVAGEVYDEALFGLTGDGLSRKAMPTVTLSGLEGFPIPITILDIRDADYDEDPTLSITLNSRYGNVRLVEPLPHSTFVLEHAYGRVVLKSLTPSDTLSALYGLVFVPEPDYSGLDAALTITIMDSTGLQDTRIINFEIAPQNVGPTITLPKEEGLYTVDEGGSVWLNRAECPMLINSNYKQLFARQLHGDELWGTFVGGSLNEGEWPIYKIPGVTNITSSSKYNLEGDFFPIKDINIGPSGSNIRNMVPFKGAVYFTAETAGEGRELWRSDGSESGTVMVIDALPGPEDSNPQFLTAWGSYLYFTASGIDTTWMIGSHAGGDDVFLPSDECRGFRSSILNPDIAFAVAKNTTWDYRKQYDCPAGYHWASTAEGNNIFRATYNNPLGSVGPVYSGLCGWNALEWNGLQRKRFRFSDSHETGTYKHAGKSEAFRPDIDPDLDNLVLEGFAGIVCKKNSDNLCSEDDKFGSALVNDCLKHSMADLWRTDGTILGTQRFSDRQHDRLSGLPAHLTIFNNSLWFIVQGIEYGSQLYCVREENDTEVELMANFTSEEKLLPSTFSMLTPAGNVLYILMSERLWALEADPGSKPKLVSMPEGFSPKFLIKNGDENSISSSGSILMSGLLDSTGIELWALDGPEDALRLVKDISPGVRSSNPCHMTYWNSKVYFQANDGKHGPELWSSDGTTEGTTLVEDIRPGAVGSYPSLLTSYKGELYMMTASDSPSSGPRPWKINGANNTASRVSSLVDPDFTGTETFHPGPRSLDSINVPPNGGGWGLGKMVGLDNSNILLIVGSKDQYGFNPPNHGLASEEYTKFVRQAACVSDADPGDVLHMNISCNKCDLSIYEISGYASHINHVLENLTYTARVTLTGWDIVTLTVTDVKGTSAQGEFSVFIQPINNSPAILGTKEGGLVDRIVNATQHHTENGGWEAFISGISIEDVDAMEGPMTLTLRVMEPGADIALDIPHSLAVLHREEGMIRVAGKLADINQALSHGIFYNRSGNVEKEQDESISDEIYIHISDNGYTGKGGPKTDEFSLSIRSLSPQQQ